MNSSLKSHARLQDAHHEGERRGELLVPVGILVGVDDWRQARGGEQRHHRDGPDRELPGGSTSA